MNVDKVEISFTDCSTFNTLEMSIIGVITSGLCQNFL